MLIWDLFLLFFGFYLLLKSSRWLISSLINIASFLKLSEYFTSFILMSFATTLPELIVGLSSAFSDFPKLAVGNSFGSNLVNVGFILGLAAVLSGRVALNGRSSQFDAWPIFFLGVAPVVLLFDLILSRLDGIILLILFFSYLLFLIFHQSSSLRHKFGYWHHHHQSRRPSRSQTIPRFKKFFIDFNYFTFSVTLLLLSAYLVVGSAHSLASFFNLSQLIIGLFILAIGTSLPELVFALRASLLAHSELSLGNLIGASVFNSTWILGLVAVINPVTINSVDLPAFFLMSSAMVLVLLIANIFLKTKGYVSRLEGLSLLFIYLIFTASNLFIYG